MRTNMGRVAHRGPRAGQTLGITLGIALVVVACGGSGLGYATAPASLDPNSPKLTAANVNFDQTNVAVPANAPFILVFENKDGSSHNVSIYQDAAYTHRTFEGALFSGPATRWYPVPALAPGTYAFRCDLHANMTGQIIAS